MQAFRVSKSGLDPMRSSPAVLLCDRFFLRLFQYWLGGSPENVESLLLTLAKSYVPDVREMDSVVEQDIAEPVLLPDKGIWHPVADKVFENADEYLAWYNQVRLHLRCVWVLRVVVGRMLKPSPLLPVLLLRCATSVLQTQVFPLQPCDAILAHVATL